MGWKRLEEATLSRPDLRLWPPHIFHHGHLSGLRVCSKETHLERWKALAALIWECFLCSVSG